jgi:hypothetical protein
MIVAWPSRDPIISVLRLMFVAMSQNRPIDAVSLSTVREPDILDGKNCFELALQILGALRDPPSGMLRGTIEQLFCFTQITWFSTAFSSRYVPDRPLFSLPFPVSGPSTLTECLNPYFRIIQLDAKPPQTQQIFNRLFSRFFFFSLGRYIWGNDHMAKDCRRVALPVMPGMISWHVTSHAFTSPCHMNLFGFLMKKNSSKRAADDPGKKVHDHNCLEPTKIPSDQSFFKGGHSTESYVTEALSLLLKWRATQVDGSARKLLGHADNAHRHTICVSMEFRRDNWMKRHLNYCIPPILHFCFLSIWPCEKMFVRMSAVQWRPASPGNSGAFE